MHKYMTKKCTNQKHRFIFIRLKARQERQLLVNIHSSKFILRLELRAKEHDQEEKILKIRHRKSEFSRALNGIDNDV